MPERRNDNEFSLVKDGHEPILEAPHVPAYVNRFGELTLLQVVEINTGYAFQVLDRSCRTAETLAIKALQQLGAIIHG